MNANDIKRTSKFLSYILRHHPDRDDVRLVQAKALMDRGRFVEARDILLDMSRDDSPHANEIVRLRAESCLVEAARAIQASTPESVQRRWDGSIDAFLRGTGLAEH